MKKTLTILILLLFNISSALSQWIPTNGPEGGAIQNIVFNNDEVYALGVLGSMFKSGKNNIKWESISTHLNNYNAVSNFAFHENYIFAATNAGILFSTDNGNNWETKNNELTNLFVNDIIKVNDYLIAGTAGGIFISTDWGNSWFPKNSGFEKLISIQCLASKDNDIYVGLMGGAVGGNPTGGGIYKSTNMDESWTLIGLSGLTVEDLKISGDTIFVATRSGFYISIDNGTTWISKSNGITNELKCFANSGSNYFAGSPTGLFVSTNEGTNWTKSNLTNSWVSNITEHGGKIYLCCGEGIFKTSNNGEIWEKLNKGLIAAQVLEMKLFSDKIYSGSYQSGLSKTEDNGETWLQTDDGMSEKSCMTLRIIENNIYSAAWGKGKIFNSTDEGKSWREDLNEINCRFIFDINKIGNNFFVTTDKGLYISKNNGIDWELMELNFIPRFIKKNGTEFYLISSKGLLVSNDDGFNWNFTPENLADTNKNLLKFEIKDSLVYCWEYNKGFVKSTDLGKTWISPSNINLADTSQISCILSNGNYLVVSTTDAGIYFSTDGGDNWKQINEGLTNTYINELLIKDDYMYAATAGAGVFKAKLSDFGIINSVENQTEFQNYLYAYPPYPMPAINEVRSLIYWDTSIDIDNDEMFVYDMYGVKVAGKEKIRIDKLTAYSGNLVWDCSGIPTGIYLINIKHGTRTRTIKAIVTK